ncbi:MAG: ferrous iron transport protein B [Clostridia bacterium]|nr:ferrous iron transport protein B [Clostridia bacterium]
MGIKIALAGNPNCGKTTLFNALTGSNQYVGNWPGVTVEKKEGKMKNNKDVIVTDLPGIYSLSPYTLEEVVARNYLINEKPDVILNIIDGTNLERNLYLTTQLIELGSPVVIAINMMDVVRKNGDVIDIEKLSKIIGCKIVEISALKGTGIDVAAQLAIAAAENGKKVPKHIFSGTVEHTLAHIEEAAVHNMAFEIQRWYSIKIFERDEKVLSELNLEPKILAHIEEDIKLLESELDDDSESIITNERYNYVESILKDTYKKKRIRKQTVSDMIDRVVTNRILALPIFMLIMFLVYTISMGTIGDWVTTFMNDTLFGEWVVPGVTSALVAIGCAPWLVSLIADGIVGGVGSVLGFVPQLLILFVMLSLLEDCGYMSRVAFIMDKLFRKFGLSGKSFIPLLVSSGCGVPGVMASRTIESERDRRMTIITTCFIPCGAKMPLIGFVAAALFGNSPLIATSAYFMGIMAVVISGLMLKKTKPFLGDPAPFVMELPAYHMPVPSNVLRSTAERGWDFIKRAGTVIVVASVLVWGLNSLSFEGGLHYITNADDVSVLNLIGSAIAVIFRPLGFGTWQATVATILGLVAKEEVVGVFGSLSSMTGEIAESGSVAMGIEFFGGNKLSAYSFMMFNLLCAPCFAAMGAIKREMNNWKWTAFALGYMCAFAYAVSLIVYQIGMAFSGNANIPGVIAAVIILIGIVYMIVRPVRQKAKK